MGSELVAVPIFRFPQLLPRAAKPAVTLLRLLAGPNVGFNYARIVQETAVYRRSLVNDRSLIRTEENEIGGRSRVREGAGPRAYARGSIWYLPLFLDSKEFPPGGQESHCVASVR
jgi:hypothetical protein